MKLNVKNIQKKNKQVYKHMQQQKRQQQQY